MLPLLNATFVPSGDHVGSEPMAFGIAWSPEPSGWIIQIANDPDRFEAKRTPRADQLGALSQKAPLVSCRSPAGAGPGEFAPSRAYGQLPRSLRIFSPCSSSVGVHCGHIELKLIFWSPDLICYLSACDGCRFNHYWMKRRLLKSTTRKGGLDFGKALFVVSKTLEGPRTRH